MVNELVLSSSSADAYRKCSWRFYLEYVEVVPQAQNVPAAIGIAVHAAVERYYKDKLLLADLPIAEANEQLFMASLLFGDYTDVYWSAVAFELASVTDPKEDVQKASASGERALMAYLEDVAPPIRPAYVEEALRVDVDGIPYSIHPDLIDTGDVIRDLKIKRNKPRDPGQYAFQQNGYALGFRVLTGRKERDVQLDIMIRLYRDRPYHWPISNGGPISAYAARLFATQLEDVANGIAKDRYLPEGLENGACNYCPVRAHCQPYQEERARAHEDTDDDA